VLQGDPLEEHPSTESAAKRRRTHSDRESPRPQPVLHVANSWVETRISRRRSSRVVRTRRIGCPYISPPHPVAS